MKKKHLIPLLILSITILTYSGSLSNDFVLLDDDYQVYENTLVKNLNARNIEALFSSSVMSMYQPLVSLLFSIIAYFFGVDAAYPFHVLSLFIHLINVLLVYIIGEKLFSNNIKSILIALIFALHPLAVEAVAWVSATSTLLFTLFFLTALLSYIQFLEKKKPKYYYLTLLLFLIGCFSKVQIIPFVGVLFIVDYLYHKLVFTSKYIFQKLPFIVIALFFAGVAYHFRIIDQIGQKPYSALYFSSYQTTWYIIKNFVPINLVAVFNWPKELTVIHHVYSIASLSIIYLIYHFRKNRLFVFGVLFFLLNIGLHTAMISKFYAPYASRYAYISSFGIWIAVISLFNKKQLLYSLGPFVVLLLFSTKSQVNHWKNTRALYTRNIEYSPNTLSYNNLGYTYIKSNKSLAESYFLKAIALDPTYTDAYNNLGAVYIESNPEKAAKYFTKTINLDSNYIEAYNNLGLIYMNSNKKKAIQYFEQSVKLNASDIKTHNSLGILYMGIDLKKSEKHFLKSIELKPKDVAAYNNLGLIYMTTNKEKAITYFEKSIVLDATNDEIYNSLGILYMNSNFKKAEMYFLKATEINPKNYNVHNNLGRLYFSSDKNKSARYFSKTIALNPKHISANLNLAILYANKDRTKAVALFNKVLALDAKNQYALFYLKKLSD